MLVFVKSNLNSKFKEIKIARASIMIVSIVGVRIEDLVFVCLKS